MKQRKSINPIPCVPFPLTRGRGGDLKEGLAPLFNALLFRLEESQREAEPLLPTIFPLSLKEEGDNGGEGVSDWAEKPKI